MNPFEVVRTHLRVHTDPLPDIPQAPRSAAQQRAIADPMLPAALAGRRLTVDLPDDAFSQFQTIQPPLNPEDTWRLYKLDEDTLQRMSPNRLIQLLADLSPEVSRALWDYLRLTNCGWQCFAVQPGTETQMPAAQPAVDAFIRHLDLLYGDVNIVISRMFMATFLRGAVFAEIILNPAGMLPIDLATPDPASARFKRVLDPERGPIWLLCQFQRGGLVPLDKPTVRYVPIDPFPSSPYGRSLAAPALFSCLFLLGLLHDLRRVIQQQGYPRLDVEIDLDLLRSSMPSDIAQDPEAFQAWIKNTVAEITNVYGTLEPDDTYIHTSVVKINRPVGTVDASSLGGVNDLIQKLEGMITRALKTMPILMGSTVSTGRGSEAAANREWEIHIAGIKAIQHTVEVVLEYLIGIGLRVQGIPAEVRFRFAELRTAEMFRDAQVQQLRLLNARMAYDDGYVSQDEAAGMALDKGKADVPEPRSTAGKPTMIAGGDPDPGSNRILLPADQTAFRMLWEEATHNPDEWRRAWEYARTVGNGHTNGHVEVDPA